LSATHRERNTGRHRGERIVALAEWGTAVLVGAAAIVLQAVHLASAGALWRDEASTVHLATLPSLRDVWTSLPYDHCPPLIHLLIRGWWVLGWADGDSGLRVLGFGVGMALLAAVWCAGRLMRHGVTLLPLALLGLNTTVMTTVDSFRGYGVGCVTSVVMTALVWRLAKRPAWANAVGASAAAVLCVQALYQNAIFVFAACCGGVAVCLLVTKCWKGVVAVLGVGIVAAAWLLPYLSILRRSQDWYALEKSGFDFSWGWQKLSAAIGSPYSAYTWVWVLLCVATLAAGFRAAVSSAPGRNAGDEVKALTVFGTVALWTGVFGFAAFLKVADLPTQPWYYVPLMAFVAVCLDATISTCHRWARPAIAAFGLVTLLVVWPSDLRAAETRHTNIDAIAARLAASATASDLIVVHPWYFGATFARYFKGATSWTTVPPLSDHDLHRYDLFKLEMQKEKPIQPVLDRVASTLRAGHQVWIVGWVPLDGTPPVETRPAPLNPWGWLDEQYSMAWGTQVGAFMTANADHGVVVSEPAATGVSPLENLPVVLVTGWRAGASIGSPSR
jgi:hypothetical protein